MQRGFGYQNRRNAGFNPATLFAGGINGAWYDPSDSTTLFSDRAGTTPCGTPGGGSVVPVGLMLDKSQGLVLGSETVTNGDFSGGTTTGWTPQSAALSVVGGQLSVVPSTTFGYAYQTLTTVVGTTYRLTFNFDQSTAAIARYFVGTSLGGGEIIGLTTVSGVGSVSRYFTATTTTTFIHFGAQNSSGLQALFDNISVRALPGNHAIAANDTTARPELSARVNLLRYSEQFDNAAWAKTNATVTPNQGTAPDGTNTVAKIVYSGGVASYQRVIEQNPGTQTAGTSIRFSIWARGENGGESLEIVDRWGGGGAVVLTTTLTRYSFTFSANGTSNNFYLQSPNNNTTVYVWGAQVTLTNQFPANTYQRIADQYTYDSTGFPRYLAFNGTSSAMSTPANVNLSGTDKATVFAGVRKIGTGTMLLVETSADSSSNNGSLSSYVVTPGTQYAYASKGTTPFVAATTGAAAYTAPVSNVLTGISDISGDSVILRLNGAQIATNTADQGSGNYGTYPLFIGSRNNASFFFNGNIYSIIVVGSAVSAGNISATEQWVAGKTGITI